MHKIWLAIVFLTAAALACGNSNTGAKVGESEAAAPPAPPPTVAIYAVGDVIQVEGFTITLNSATIDGGLLKANFTLDNPGPAEVPLTSLVGFEAKNPDGVKLEQEYFDCGSSFDGKVLPGDKLRGDICWKAAAGGVKIYYTPNLFGEGAIVWQVN